MALVISINGVDRREDFDKASPVRVSDVLNGRSSIELQTMPVDWDDWEPVDGQSVVLQALSVAEFRGLVRDPEIVLMRGALGKVMKFSAVSKEAICDRKIVAAIYTNQTLGAIVSDIVTQKLSAEGFTATHVEAGPTIAQFVCNYVTVTEAFNQLSELTGYTWWFDPILNDLRFCARASVVGPTMLTKDNVDGVVRRSRAGDYRNTQYVRAGVDLTASRTESFVGDGTSRTFVLGYPAGTVPTITVGGVAKTVGIKGVETGKDWYWNKNESEIVQDAGATPLSAVQTLAVTYQGLFPIVVTTQDDSEIARRATTEGTTGVYERVDDAPEIDTSAWALALGAAKLARFGRIQQELVVTTMERGFRAGQLVTVNMAELGCVGEYLAESVQHVFADDSNPVATLTLLSGDTVGGWQAFYRALQAAGRSFVIRENEVLVIARTVTPEVVTCGDSLTTTTPAGPESRIGFAQIGYSELAASPSADPTVGSALIGFAEIAA